MATARDYSPERCVTCSKTCPELRKLRCSHSFCQACLGDLKKIHPGTVNCALFPCPSCAEKTRGRDPDLDIAESRDVSQKAPDTQPSPGASCCSICKDEGQIIPAVVWCPECAESLCRPCMKSHRNFPDLKKHKLVDLPEFIPVKAEEKSPKENAKPIAKPEPKKMRKCKEHTDREIEMYCKNCRKGLCTVCHVLNHRRCESVVPMKEMIPEMKRVLEENQKKLTQQMNQKKAEVAEKKALIKDKQENREATFAEIRAATRQALNIVKEKERRMLEELDRVTEEHKEKLEISSKRHLADMQTYIQYQKYIEILMERGNPYQLFQFYHACATGEIKPPRFDPVPEEDDVVEDLVHMKQDIERDLKKLTDAIENLELGRIEIVDEGMIEHRINHKSKLDSVPNSSRH